MKDTDVLIVGLGHIGGEILEQLARQPGIPKIAACDVREDHGEKRVNQAIAGADQLGYSPNIKFLKIDLLEETEKIAEILREINPRVIMNTVTMMSPWIKTLLPDEILEPLYRAGGFGPWVAFHLRLTYRLMQALKLANLDCRVVNAAYADAVNPALHGAGLAPTVGGGNVDSMALMARLWVARHRNIKVRDVRVYLVEHHYNNRWFAGGLQGNIYTDEPAPFFLKIMVDDRDVTDSYDKMKLLSFAACGYGRLDGHAGDPVTGSSMVKHTLALLRDAKIFTHAPGPNGLVGGYPIRLGWDEVKLALPSEITREEAIKINLEGQRRDGIEEIKDGNIVFTEAVHEALKKVFSFDCKSFKVSEVDEVAEEQMRKFRETADKYK